MPPITYGRKGQLGSLAKTPSTVEQKRLAAATELVENDDLLVYLFLDTLTSRRKRLGAHYQNQKWAEAVEDERPGQALRVLQGSIRQTLLPVRESFLSIPLIAQHCENKQKPDLQRLLTHLDRYIRLFHSTSRIEILPTNRYTKVTGKKELAVYATAPLSPSGPEGVELWESGGQLAAVPNTWDKDLEKEAEDDGIWTRDGFLVPPVASSPMQASPSPSCTDTPPIGSVAVERKSKRGFSIVESTRHGPCMYLGPGRFINHDCEPNCQLIPKSGMSMTFRVVKPIKVGEELTTFYGGDYFGVGNRECMCASCEKAGVGWYSETRGASVDTEAGPSTSISDVSLMAASDHETPERDGESDLSLVAAKKLKEAALKWKTRLHRSRLNEQNGVKLTPQPSSSSTSKQGRKGGLAEKNVNKVVVHDPRDPPGTNRCETCLNVIQSGRRRAGSKVQTACFRCRRHWKIYHLPWPARTTATVAARPPRHLTPSWYKDYKMEVPLGVVASRVLREGALLSRNLAARTPVHEEIVVEPRYETEEVAIDPGDKTKRKGKARRTEAKRPNTNVAALPPSWTALKAMPSILQEPPEPATIPQLELETQPTPAPPPKKKQRTKAQDENLKKGNGLWLRWGWAEVEESSEFTPVILPEGSKRSRRGASGLDAGSSSATTSTRVKERTSTRSRKNASGTSRANSRATSQPQSAHSQDVEIQAEAEQRAMDPPVDHPSEPDASMNVDEVPAVEKQHDGPALTGSSGESEAALATSVHVETPDSTALPEAVSTPTLDDMAERETSRRKRRRSRSSSSSGAHSSPSVQNDSQWAGPVIRLAELARGRKSKDRWHARLTHKGGRARASEGDDDDVDMVLDETEGVLSDQEVEAYDSADGTPGPEVAAPACQQQ